MLKVGRPYFSYYSFFFSIQMGFSVHMAASVKVLNDLISNKVKQPQVSPSLGYGFVSVVSSLEEMAPDPRLAFQRLVQQGKRCWRYWLLTNAHQAALSTLLTGPAVKRILWEELSQRIWASTSSGSLGERMKDICVWWGNAILKPVDRWLL